MTQQSLKKSDDKVKVNKNMFIVGYYNKRKKFYHKSVLYFYMYCFQKAFSPHFFKYFLKTDTHNKYTWSLYIRTNVIYNVYKQISHSPFFFNTYMYSYLQLFSFLRLYNLKIKIKSYYHWSFLLFFGGGDKNQLVQ